MKKETLLIFKIEDYSYGIWETDIKDIVSGMSKLHKLPYFPDRVAGMSSVSTQGSGSDSEDPKSRMGTFFDLAYCLGHNKLDANACLFTMSSNGKSAKESIEGFAVPVHGEALEADKKEIVPIPKELKLTELLGCIKTGKGLVPVIDIKGLYKDVKDKNWELPAFDIIINNENINEDIKDKKTKNKKNDSVRLFSLNAGKDSEDGKLYGVDANLLEEKLMNLDSTCKVKFAPPEVECFALNKDGITVVLNGAALAGYSNVDITGGSVLKIAGSGLALLVDGDSGVSKSKLSPMSDIVSTSVISSALVSSGDVVPILNFSEFISSGLGDGNKEVSNYDVKGSDFAKSFGREEVSILQFTIKGIKQAIPRSEEVDSFDFKSPRHIEGLPSIVLGVVEHDGEILPVIDPAVCFGFYTESPFEKMILMKKGKFKAFIVTENKPSGIVIDVSNQKSVPISMDKDYIYGCYVEDDTVGLILNMEALLVDFNEEEFKEYFGAISKDMVIEPEDSAVEPQVEAQPEDLVDSVAVEEPLTVEEPADIENPENSEDQVAASTAVEDIAEKIDATVFDNKEVSSENLKNEDHEKPDIKAEFEKYKNNLEEDSNEPHSGENIGADYLEYEEDIKDGKSSNGQSSNEQSPDEKSSNETTSDETPSNVHSFGGAGAVEGFKEESKEEKKKELLVLLAVFFVSMILLFLFIGIGGEEATEASKAINSNEEPKIKVIKKVEVPIAAVSVEVAAPKVNVQWPDGSIFIEINPSKEEVSISKIKKGDVMPEGVEMYIVIKGDTLWHIARRLTGNPFDYPKLAENSEIKDPNLIYPEQKIYVKVIGS